MHAVKKKAILDAYMKGVVNYLSFRFAYEDLVQMFQT